MMRYTLEDIWVLSIPDMGMVHLPVHGRMTRIETQTLFLGSYLQPSTTVMLFVTAHALQKFGTKVSQDIGIQILQKKEGMQHQCAFTTNKERMPDLRTSISTPIILNET